MCLHMKGQTITSSAQSGANLHVQPSTRLDIVSHNPECFPQCSHIHPNCSQDSIPRRGSNEAGNSHGIHKWNTMERHNCHCLASNSNNLSRYREQWSKESIVIQNNNELPYCLQITWSVTRSE